MHVPDAPPALATLLYRLRAEADTTIAPACGAWYAGRGDNGSYGPHASAEDACVALVRHLWQRYDETRAERDFAQAERDFAAAEAHALRTALAEARRVALDTARVLEQLARQ